MAIKKKLQVFVSSTYQDLKHERQAVVEAILRAGHIPAGMELFAAGNESQLETIRRWIDESDAFMLILGGRYGTIEDKSQKSYTHLEYDYAVKKGKPFFSAVITPECLDAKVKAEGRTVLESERQDLYKSFHKQVTSKTCRFFKDNTELKLAVFESLNDIARDETLSGWIRGDQVADPGPMVEELNRLRLENSGLSKRLTEKNKLNNHEPANADDEIFDGLNFDGLWKVLQSVNTNETETNDSEIAELTLGSAFIRYADEINLGVETIEVYNNLSGPIHRYLLYTIVPKLMPFKLVIKTSRKSGASQYSTSPIGLRFLAMATTRFNSNLTKDGD